MRIADLALRLLGATSGEQIIKAAAAASGAITLPAGTTDFSGTGGTSQVVKQTTAGGAFTVGQVAATEVSGLAGLTANALIKGGGAGAAPVASTATVDGSGNLTVSGDILTVTSSNSPRAHFYNTSDNTHFGVQSGGNALYIAILNSSGAYTTEMCHFSSSGSYKPGGGTWLDSSDVRLKREVTPYRRGLDAIMALHPVRFRFNGKGGTSDDGRVFTGLVADDTAEIMPEMIGTTRARLDPEDEDETDILTLDATPLIYALVNSVKELTARVRVLEAALSVRDAPTG